jgi:hypothetical protein
MVLVIDDNPWPEPTWLTQVRELFAVVTISTLAGASVAIEGQDVAAVVLVLSEIGMRADLRASTPGLQPRAWISALRRHPSLDRTAVFIVSRNSALVSADLVGLTDVDVLEPEQADFDLSLRVGAVAPRMSSRPAPRRPSDLAYLNDTRRLESLVPKRPASEPLLAPVRAPSSIPRPVDAPIEPKTLQRFARECVERGARGLVLCEQLSQRHVPTADRERAAAELGELLDLAEGDAALLHLRDLALLFGMAELVVSRLNVGKGQLIVPRGVVGLLSALLELGRIEQLARFDVELHRTRLASAIER